MIHLRAVHQGCGKRDSEHNPHRLGPGAAIASGLYLSWLLCRAGEPGLTSPGWETLPGQPEGSPEGYEWTKEAAGQREEHRRLHKPGCGAGCLFWSHRNCRNVSGASPNRTPVACSSCRASPLTVPPDTLGTGCCRPRTVSQAITPPCSQLPRPALSPPQTRCFGAPTCTQPGCDDKVSWSFRFYQR